MPKNAQDFRKQKAAEKLKKRLEKDGITQEQIAYERKVNKGRLETDLICDKRELKYKEEQLTSGIIEKNESAILNVRSFPKDDTKPKFLLENEIDVLKRKIEEGKTNLENLKEVENAESS